MNKQKQVEKFIGICKLSQEELANEMVFALQKEGYKAAKRDGFVYAKGEIPILLTAHLDTVHKQLVKSVVIKDHKGKTIISSPQGIGGDDRCGVFMIMEIVKKYKCSVLFCEDEEIGSIGADKFVKSEFINDVADMNFIIELDRANANDAVFYDCDNPKFTEFVLSNTKYVNQVGSFSDISVIAPTCGVAAVNLSCGYFYPHTKGEEVVFEDMLNTIEKVKLLIAAQTGERFEYIEAEPIYKYSRNYAFDDYYSYYDYCEVYVQYRENGKLKDAISVGKTKGEASFNFFVEHPYVCYNQVETIDTFYDENDIWNYG